jgi:hypothetical protein
MKHSSSNLFLYLHVSAVQITIIYISSSHTKMVTILENTFTDAEYIVIRLLLEQYFNRASCRNLLLRQMRY